jgi:hypothetical protein
MAYILTEPGARDQGILKRVRYVRKVTLIILVNYLEIHSDLKEILGKEIPNSERPFTAILFVDRKGGALNFGWPKHKVVRTKFSCGDLVVFPGDVFH